MEISLAETFSSSLGRKVCAGLSLDGISTIVTEGKFCRKMLYVNGPKTIDVREEIGYDYQRILSP